MTSLAEDELLRLTAGLRQASLARIGGFRPPTDPLTSWFGRGVACAGESVPQWRGKPMFPLLQIRVSELPVVPPRLAGTQMLVLFHNQDEAPFRRPHGEGWSIREYASLDGLQPLPAEIATIAARFCRPFPIRWESVTDDAPGWETAGEIVDLRVLIADDAAAHRFHHDFNRYACTKVGGFPCEIQHAAELTDYVFQVGSEEKTGWMWADNGIGYFYKAADGTWSWACQFY